MKCLFSVLFTLVWVVSTAQNNLYIAGPDGQGVSSHEVLTGGSFQLDYTFSIPGDECKRVKLTIPANPNLIINSSGILFNGLHNITSQGGNIIFAATVLNGQNVKINGVLKGDGTLCDDQSILYSINAQYYSIDDSPCGSPMQSNEIIIKPEYDFAYQQYLSFENNGTACKGGFVKYKVSLPARSDLGYFRLYDVKFRCEVNATLISVLGENGANWTITDIAQNNNSCSKTYEFYYNGATTNTMNLKIRMLTTIDLVFKTECSCFENNQNFQLNLIANGSDPCGRNKIFSKSDSKIINSSCCSIPASGEVMASKILEDFSKPFCSGGCHPYYYELRYSNANSALAVNNLVVNDPLPSGILVKYIELPRFQTNGNDIRYKICYSTQSNPTEQCVQVGTSARPYNQWYVAALDIRSVRIEFIDPIPAWYNTLIKFTIGFGINADVPFMNDNESTFISDNPSFNITSKVIHGQIPICPPFYNASLFMVRNNVSYQTISTFPGYSERIRISISNQGSGTSLATLFVNLPQDLTYQNNITYGLAAAGNQITYQALPSNVNINYNQVTNQISIENLAILSCNNQSLIIEFEVKIANGAAQGPRGIIYRINNGTSNRRSITINDYYKINARIYQRCKSGDLISLENKVLASESLEYVYELENVGNESVNEIKIFNHKPKQSDFTLNSPNQVARNSEVSTNYSGNIYELNNVPVQAQYISSISNNDICSASFGGPASSPENATMMVIKPQDPDYILGPGQKIQIVQKHTIDPGQPLNSICNNDFSFCLRRVQFTTPDNGISDQIRLTLSDTTLCPKVVGCDEVANIETRFEDAFNVQVSGNQVTLTAQNLSNNDQWSLVWDDEQYFANESHWGNQTVSRTFPNNVTGQHKLCIKIKNHLEANNSQSQECKCELICKTFNLN
jgi:hypothetical protein